MLTRKRMRTENSQNVAPNDNIPEKAKNAKKEKVKSKSKKISKNSSNHDSDSEFVNEEKQKKSPKNKKAESKTVKTASKSKSASKTKSNGSKSIESVVEQILEDDVEADAAVLASIKELSTKSTILGPARVRLGLCCINNLLKNQKEAIFCSRTLTVASYKEKGSVLAKERALKNVLDIPKLIKWNYDHHIEVFRLSSEIFPQYTNYKHIEEKDRYTLEFAYEALIAAGKLAKDLNMRLTFHPGQFNVVGTPRPEVFEATVRELKMHADIFDLMGMDGNSILVVHGGGVYGDKDATIKRWIDNFKLLPENVQRRLVLENDEKNFSVTDCLAVNKEIGIPVVFDNHHFNCYKLLHPQEKFKKIDSYIGPVLETWLKRGLRPKFHLSEQKVETRTGAHSDYIKKFPEYYLNIPEKFGIGVDVMVEAKAKEAAILDLYKQHKNNFLGHLDSEKVPDDMLNFNKEDQAATICSRCKFDTMLI